MGEQTTIDTLHERHRILSAHRCSCGWEGDNATVHIIDVLALRPVAWEWDDLDRAIIRPADQMPDDPRDAPLFRLGIGEGGDSG